MDSKKLATMIRNALDGAASLDTATMGDLAADPVREDGHGVNFIVTDPDGNRRRIIVTEP
jgi:hypothetical protein